MEERHKQIFEFSLFPNEVNFIEKVNVIFFHLHTVSLIFWPILKLEINAMTVSKCLWTGLFKKVLTFFIDHPLQFAAFYTLKVERLGK